MRMLVTGAAGFLGSHLALRLLRDGHSVVGIDNFLTGTPRALAPLLDHAAFSFVEADVAARMPRVGSVDAIFHFASPASPVDYHDKPIQTMLANSSGTHHCCELALEHGSRVIFASTSEIYGDPEIHPQPEEYVGHVNSIGPRACYDESKRFAEALLTSYRRSVGLDIRIVRIFNTYGPGMRAGDGRVIPSFISNALAGEPLLIHGDGSQTRSLCYVDDLIDGIVRYGTIDEPRFRVMNLGSDCEETVRAIAELVSALCHREQNFRHAPLPQDDPKRRKPTIARARTMLKWQPVTSLRDGLMRTIDAFRRSLVA